MSFEVLFRDEAVFGGVGEGESRPGSKVDGMDGCKPHVIFRKVCCSRELEDEGADAGKVMGIQVGGSGVPLCRNRLMSLGKERKTPEFGAGEFAPAAKDDHVVLGEHSDCSFFKQNLAVVVTKFPNPHHIVMEVEYDIPACDREPREDHIKICRSDMRGATIGANNNLQRGAVDIGAGGTKCQIEVTFAVTGNCRGIFWEWWRSRMRGWATSRFNSKDQSF